MLLSKCINVLHVLHVQLQQYCLIECMYRLILGYNCLIVYGHRYKYIL